MYRGLVPDFFQPAPELQDLLLGADHEETVAGLEVGIAGWEDKAMGVALDAADEDADFAKPGEFRDWAIHVGATLWDGDVFAGEVGEGCGVFGGTDAGGEMTFGDGQLVGGTEEEKAVAGVEGFISAGVHPGEAIAIEGEDGASGRLTEAEVADAASGDVGLEGEGDFGNFQIPMAWLVEDGKGDACGGSWVGG